MNGDLSVSMVVADVFSPETSLIARSFFMNEEQWPEVVAGDIVCVLQSNVEIFTTCSFEVRTTMKSVTNHAPLHLVSSC